MLIVCITFAGLFQLSQIFVAKEILDRAARCAIRARTVGFNSWMVEKCTRIACIPNSGLITTPLFVDSSPDIEPLVQTLNPGALWDAVLAITPVSDQAALELARIPAYLCSDYPAQAEAILDYADWDSVNADSPSPVITDPSVSAAMLEASASQDFPLRIPLHQTFYGADSVLLTGDAEMECHYSLYLDDQNW